MFKIGDVVKTVLEGRQMSPPTELEALLHVAIDILGRMALRRRDKLWAHDVRQLEDDLFEVLEKLNNVYTSENSPVAGVMSTDGTP